MQTLNVDLGDRSYPIYIGAGLLSNTSFLAQHIPGKKVAVITNETVAPLYLSSVKQLLDEYNYSELILPDGEQYKTLETANLIFDHLLENKHDRNCTLIALGGGVIGDLTGFAAACYQRGVHFIQIPTTLLAQVDSSVGGKTGVNHPLGKNMIGAFYQPRCVLADVSTLNTLEDNQYAAGVAEVIKYGLIRDPEFFAWLQTNMSSLMQRDADSIIQAVERSCQNKAIVVAEDELERSGARALLNLGHTFGHAIETSVGYGQWLHGEAVACGMSLAAQMSRNIGWISDESVETVNTLLEQASLPIEPPTDMTTQQFLDCMAVDKKVKDGVLPLILLKSIGDAIVSTDYNKNSLLQVLDEATSTAN